MFDSRSFTKNSLRHSPSLLFLLAITLCIISFYSAEMRFQGELTTRIEETHAANRNITRIVEENVRRTLSQADNILWMMKIDMESYGRLEDKHVDLLKSFLDIDIINQIAVADTTGNLIFSAVSLERPLNISEREHFKAQIERDSGALYIAAPWINRATGTPSIFLSRRINDINGNFAGIVAVGLDQKYLTKVFSQLELGVDNSIVLLRADGSFLARVPGNISFEKMTTGYPSHLAFERISKGLSAGTYESVAVSDEIIRYGAYRTVQDYPLVVLSGISKEGALRTVMERRAHYYFRAGLFSVFVLAALLTIWIQMRRQIEISATLKVSQGRYRALLKQSSEAFIVAEFETGRILEVNKAFVAMFGFSEEEASSMNVFSLIEYVEAVSEDTFKTNFERDGILPADMIYFINKKGQRVCVQRVASFISYLEQRLIMISYQDITAEQQLQSQIQREVSLAGKVQRTMLPPDYMGEKLIVRTIYRPVHLVSGDSFAYRWSRDRSKFYGYLIDVTGHGMATALHTSAIGCILDGLMDEAEGWTKDTIVRLNKQLINYFQDDSFLAIITFAIDFRQKTLSCISGGINQLLVDRGGQPELLKIPSSYLGILPNVEIETIVFPFCRGDAFYFISDGLYDRMQNANIASARDFEATMHSLLLLAQNGESHDDCSAVCIRILSTQPYPVSYDLSDDSQSEIGQRMMLFLREIAPKDWGGLGIVIGEAISNAKRYGTKVWLKINLIGDKLLIRVRDNGPGFPGNAKLQEIKRLGKTDLFDIEMLHESGRGIQIMVSWMDKVIYNKSGNEVLLIKKLNTY